jgi:acyl-CoA thioesterase FadM
MVRNGMTEDRGPASIIVQRRIEWPDTDASGRWHNTAGFRFIEVAETALLERLGLLDEVYGHLPRARIEADFKRLLLFRDVLDCFLAVTRVGRTSINYVFELRKGGEVCMAADVTAVLIDESGAPKEWPQEYRELLMKAGPQSPELLVVS